MSRKSNIYLGTFLVIVTMLMMLFLPAVQSHAASNNPYFSPQNAATKNTNAPILAEQQYSTASLNWAGYVAYTSGSNPQNAVTSVSGSWVVQTVQSSHKAVYSAQWIGIGGYFSGDSSLIQTGTSSDAGSGGTSYYSWYELLPAAETQLSMHINPGDVMAAHIFLVSGTYGSTQTWNIYLNDTSDGGHSYEQVSYSSSMLSAEWIEERPAISGSLTTLANFGTAYYGQNYTVISGTNSAVINGISGSISQFAYTSITMVNQKGQALATPGPLNDAGTSFVVLYGSGSSSTGGNSGHGGHGGKP